MKALLICPSDRENAAFLSRRQPLALVPLLGRTALDRAMADLARRGAKDITVIAADRPVLIRAAIAAGKPWGVQAEVISVSHEPTPEEARAKYKTAGEAWLPEPFDAITLEGWPQSDSSSIWHSPSVWFDSLKLRLDEAGASNVGMRQFKPGVWVGTKSRISPSATLNAPCWIGQQAWIAAGATVGPDAIIEQGACVDQCAEVVNSHVAPITYVGSDVELRNSLASGGSLLNWTNGSQTEVTDAFLLADISMRATHRNGALLTRVTALLTLFLALPVFLFAALRCLLSGNSVFIRHRCVPTPMEGDQISARPVLYFELNGVSGLWRRLPELWNVFCGQFHWVGNRPLAPMQAEALASEFERLWLAVPSGVFSLADVEDCPDVHGDAALAHAAFYATNRNSRMDVKILMRALARLIMPAEPGNFAISQNTNLQHLEIVNPAT
jgi:hypothetical protein